MSYDSSSLVKQILSIISQLFDVTAEIKKQQPIAAESERILSELYEAANYPSLNIDNLISTKSEAEKKEEEMPRYSDGSFTSNIRNTGLIRYRFIYKDKRVSVYGYSKQECWNKRTELIESGGPARPQPKAPNVVEHTVASWLKIWYKTYKTRADGNKINPDNDLAIERISKSTLGKMRLSEVKDMDVQTFLKGYEKKTNTRKKLAQIFNSALNKAVKNRIIPYNPFDIETVGRHVSKPHPVILAKDHLRLLKAVKEPAYLNFVWFMVGIGARLEEGITSIYNVSIDFDKCVVYIINEDTETKKHKREIPFLPELLTLEKVQAMQRIKYGQAEKYFLTLFKSLEIKAVIHSFRKTFASCAYHVGFSDKWIQRMLGQKTLKVTQDTYIELIEDVPSPFIDYFRRLHGKLFPQKP